MSCVAMAMDQGRKLVFVMTDKKFRYCIYEIDEQQPAPGGNNGDGAIMKLGKPLLNMSETIFPYCMSFTAIGSRIFMLGGLIDLGENARASKDCFIYDIASNDLSRGPNLNAGKVGPHLITMGTKIFVLSNSLYNDDCTEDPVYDEPLFEMLDTDHLQRGWCPLTLPALQIYDDDSSVQTVDALAAVCMDAGSSSGGFIFLSVSCAGTYAFNVDKQSWNYVTKQPLPFSGDALSLTNAPSLCFSASLNSKKFAAFRFHYGGDESCDHGFQVDEIKVDKSEDLFEELPPHNLHYCRGQVVAGPEGRMYVVQTGVDNADADRNIQGNRYVKVIAHELSNPTHSLNEGFPKRRGKKKRKILDLDDSKLLKGCSSKKMKVQQHDEDQVEAVEVDLNKECSSKKKKKKKKTRQRQMVHEDLKEETSEELKMTGLWEMSLFGGPISGDPYCEQLFVFSMAPLEYHCSQRRRRRKMSCVAMDQGRKLVFVMTDKKFRYCIYEIDEQQPAPGGNNGDGAIMKLGKPLLNMSETIFPYCMTFTAIGSRIFMLGGLIDLGENARASKDCFIYDIATDDLSRGPNLNAGKVGPHLITMGTKIFVLSHLLYNDDCTEDPVYDEPLFEMLDTDHLESGWCPLTLPALQIYDDDSSVQTVDALAAVCMDADSSSGGFIFLSVSCAGTYAFNVDKQSWNYVTKQPLPFSGDALSLTNAPSLCFSASLNSKKFVAFRFHYGGDESCGHGFQVDEIKVDKSEDLFEELPPHNLHYCQGQVVAGPEGRMYVVQTGVDNADADRNIEGNRYVKVIAHELSNPTHSLNEGLLKRCGKKKRQIGEDEGQDETTNLDLDDSKLLKGCSSKKMKVQHDEDQVEAVEVDLNKESSSKKKKKKKKKTRQRQMVHEDLKEETSEELKMTGLWKMSLFGGPISGHPYTDQLFAFSM